VAAVMAEAGIDGNEVDGSDDGETATDREVTI